MQKPTANTTTNENLARAHGRLTNAHFQVNQATTYYHVAHRAAPDPTRTQLSAMLQLSKDANDLLHSIKQLVTLIDQTSLEWARIAPPRPSLDS